MSWHFHWTTLGTAGLAFPQKLRLPQLHPLHSFTGDAVISFAQFQVENTRGLAACRWLKVRLDSWTAMLRGLDTLISCPKAAVTFHFPSRVGHWKPIIVTAAFYALALQPFRNLFGYQPGFKRHRIGVRFNAKISG